MKNVEMRQRVFALNRAPAFSGIPSCAACMAAMPRQVAHCHRKNAVIITKQKRKILLMENCNIRVVLFQISCMMLMPTAKAPNEQEN
ncbi:hypothetical protein [Paraburkholderia rhizosphaerae]|uniref:hypothetical protein n=1 Tax=Paraburkholderia rhizosphaerae TaxID=480658 RepID=UPI001064A58C|nr:hypothetical protein [Paraburkholderia rhizosphaerae]